MDTKLKESILDRFENMHIKVLDSYENKEKQRTYFIVKTELEKVANMKDAINAELRYNIKNRYNVNFTMHEMISYYRFEFWDMDAE